MPASLTLLDAFSALADPTRCRMLRVLDGHELTVSELCSVLQLPQSTVSRHLKTLADADLVASRRDGTSRYYTLAVAGEDDAHARIWQITREEFDGRPGVEQDARRLVRILARRSASSQQFFASAAGQWDRLRAELFGEDLPGRALLGLLPGDWRVGDLGCGTGAVVAALAPHVRQVVGVDASDEMLAAARARLAGVANADLRRGTLEALPIADAVLDAAVMMLVLPHLPSPAAALAEARRVLAPGGRLLVVDMTSHEHEEYRQQMGHVWLGFTDEQVRRFAELAGLSVVHLAALSPSTAARGPALFSAVMMAADRARPAPDDARAGPVGASLAG